MVCKPTSLSLPCASDTAERSYLHSGNNLKEGQKIPLLYRCCTFAATLNRHKYPLLENCILTFYSEPVFNEFAHLLQWHTGSGSEVYSLYCSSPGWSQPSHSMSSTEQTDWQRRNQYILKIYRIVVHLYTIAEHLLPKHMVHRHVCLSVNTGRQKLLQSTQEITRKYK